MSQVLTTASTRVNSATNWKAGAWAGMVAGIIFLMSEMVLVWAVQGQSPWEPPQMMAAMVQGSHVLPAMGAWAPFDLKIVMAALTIHFTLSLAYGLVGAWLMDRFYLVGAVMFGAALGLVVYLVNFYLVAPMVFPWFEMGRNWIGAFSHIMFGASLGWAYIWLRKSKTSAAQAPGRLPYIIY